MEIKQLGVRIAYYFGERKLNYQLNLIAAAANLKRLAKWLKEKGNKIPGISAPNGRKNILKTAETG